MKKSHAWPGRRNIQHAFSRVVDRVPSATRSYVEPVRPVSFGRMDSICTICGASHWLFERVEDSLSSKTANEPTYDVSMAVRLLRPSGEVSTEVTLLD